MAQLYANENFPLPAVEALRQLGHNVLTTSESGRAGVAIPDEDVLGFAIAEQRTLLTLNRKHFIRLHHARRDHAGIIVCSFDLDYTALASRIHNAIEAHVSLSGQLLRINRPG